MQNLFYIRGINGNNNFDTDDAFGVLLIVFIVLLFILFKTFN